MKPKGTMVMERIVWKIINEKIKEITDRLEAINVDCYHDGNKKWKWSFEKVK